MLKGVVHAKGRPTAAFDPEGLIFALGVDSSTVKMYDLRAYESVSCLSRNVMTRLI